MKVDFGSDKMQVSDDAFNCRVADEFDFDDMEIELDDIEPD